MITEIGIKQFNFNTSDLVQQETNKQITQPVRPPDDVQKGYGGKKKDDGGLYPTDNKESGLSNEVLQAFKQEFDLINNVEVKFNKDDETGQTYIKIVDKDSGDIIREIPPEEVRKLAEKLDEMVGLLFDKKV